MKNGIRMDMNDTALIFISFYSAVVCFYVVT